MQDDKGRPHGLGGLLAPFPVATAVLFTIIGAFPLFLTSAYAVRLQDSLNFGATELGIAVASYFVLGTIGANRLGPYIDRFGASVGLRIAASHSVVAAIIIAFLASSWGWIALALAIAGFGNAFSNLAANRLIASRAGTSRQGIGFGAKQAGIPLGSLTAGFIVSAFGPVAWETTFAIFAGVALVMAIISPGGNKAVHRTETVTRGVGDSFHQLLLLAIGGGAAGATGNSLAVFLVDAFESLGFSESNAALALAIGSASAVAARLAIGRAVDARGSDGYQELVVLMAAGSVGFIVLALAGTQEVVLIIGAIGAFAAAWGWPAVIYFTAVKNSNVQPATATGFVLSGVFMGTIFGPPVLGFIADRSSFRWSWALSAVLIGAAALLVTASRNVGRRRNLA